MTLPHTRIVNLRHETFDVYIGRAGRGEGGYFGNPFVIGPDGPRERVLELYLLYFAMRVEKDPEFRNRVLALKGLRLG